MKFCYKCKQEKHPEDFNHNRANKDGRNDMCKTCRKEHRRAPERKIRAAQLAASKEYRERRRVYAKAHRQEARAYEQLHAEKHYIRRKAQRRLAWYGMDQAAFDLLRGKQKGVCVICLMPPEKRSVEKPDLHIDHDHLTGRIRGLLCNPCNRGLGFMMDSQFVLQRAADYITFHAGASIPDDAPEGIPANPEAPLLLEAEELLNVN